MSLLLKIARDSITEVLEATRHIDTIELKKEYAILSDKMATAVTLFIDDEVRSHYCSLYPTQSLIDDLIKTAKIAAFESENYPPITTSEYLHVSLQVSILTPLKELLYDNIDELQEQIAYLEDGILMSYDNKEAYLFPDTYKELNSTIQAINKLKGVLNIGHNLNKKAKIYTFKVQNAKDKPILSSL